MAQLDVLWSALEPEATDGVWAAPLSLYTTTNDRWPHAVLVFDDVAGDTSAFLSFIVPDDYASSPSVIAVWAADATTGNASFGVTYRNTGAGDGWDQTGEDETEVVQTVAVPGTAFDEARTTFTLSGTAWAVGNRVAMQFKRRTGNAADTLAGKAFLVHLLLSYST